MQPEKKRRILTEKSWCIFMTRAVASVISDQGPLFSKMAMAVMHVWNPIGRQGRYEGKCEVSTFNSCYSNVAYVDFQTSE